MQNVFSRVIISHWFRVLHSPLNGLQGSGVEDFLSFPAVTPASSAQRLLVQNMNPQQETVVHDLKALQHLSEGTHADRCERAVIERHVRYKSG